MKPKIKITVKHVFYGEKYGGDDCYAEIYKGKELVGKVFRNGYLNEIRGVDLRLSDKDNNDLRAYYYPDKKLSHKEQILDAICNTIFIIGRNDDLFNR